MQGVCQSSLKHIVTVSTDTQENDFIKENISQKGSIIDLLRKHSGNSNYDIGDLGQARIRTQPQFMRSLKSMQESYPQEYNFGQNAESQLFIEDIQMKKIQSQIIVGNNNSDEIDHQTETNK